MAKKRKPAVRTPPTAEPSPGSASDTSAPAAADTSTPSIPKVGALRNRVVERRRLLGSDLVPNEKNWREHGPEQTAALRAVLNEIGMAGELLAYKSERNGGKLTLINGHKRSSDFPGELWDVAITDLSDVEADKLLAVLDPIGGMGGTDPAKMVALCAEIDAETEELQALIDLLGAEADDVTFKAAGGEGGEGSAGSRGAGLAHNKNFRIRPVLDVAQVKTFEAAVLATGNMARGEAIIEICEAYLASKQEKG